MSTADYKKTICDLLELISSEEKQLEYESRVPSADVPSELVCQWFDDIYHPDSELFCQCFSPEQLDALRMFNDFYGKRTDYLPDPAEGLRAYHESAIWKEIMSEAKITLIVLTKA